MRRLLSYEPLVYEALATINELLFPDGKASFGKHALRSLIGGQNYRSDLFELQLPGCQR
jgi:hypothetical protein